MFREIFSNLRIIYRLSIIDFRSFFKSSILSYFWVFVSPMLMIGMYIFSFYAAQGPSGIENIELPNFNSHDFIFLESAESIQMPKIGWLIIGVLTWTYVGSILSAGSNSMKTYSWLITKVGVPLSVPPMVVNFSKAYIGIFSIIISWFIYMVVAVCNGNNPISLNILQLPLMLSLLFIFLSLWSLMVSPLTAISRDFFNLILVVPMILQWITGVFLPLSPTNMNSAIGIIFRVNPFNFLISNIRCSIMGNGFFWNDAIALISFVGFFMLFLFLAFFFIKKSKRIVVDLI